MMSNLIIKLFAEYGEFIDALKWGESFTINCPRCDGGVVTISKSSYNGHLWVVCNKCGIIMLQ